MAWAAILLLAGVCKAGVAQAGTSPAAASQASSQSPQQSSSQPPQQSPSQASAPAAATAQTPQKSAERTADDPGADTGDITKIRVGINEVNVVFTVTDKHGKRVTDLKEADFRIVDDAKPAAEIRSFHAETNLPLQVGLLIDASSSVRDRFKFSRNRRSSF